MARRKKGRFKKGSLEAKRFMAKLRRMRMSKKRRRHKRVIKRKSLSHRKRKSHKKRFRFFKIHHRRQHYYHRKKVRRSSIPIAAILPITLGVGLIGSVIKGTPQLPQLPTTPSGAVQLAGQLLGSLGTGTTTTLITSGGQIAPSATPPLIPTIPTIPSNLVPSTTPLTQAQLGILMAAPIFATNFGANQTAYQGLGIYSFGGSSYLINSASMFAQIAPPLVSVVLVNPIISANPISVGGGQTNIVSGSTLTNTTITGSGFSPNSSVAIMAGATSGGVPVKTLDNVTSDINGNIRAVESGLTIYAGNVAVNGVGILSAKILLYGYDTKTGKYSPPITITSVA